MPYANFGDPQSLNLYAYVRNNPVGSIDADGHADRVSYKNEFGGPMPDTVANEAVSAADPRAGENIAGTVNLAALAELEGAQNLIPASVLQRMQEELHSGKFGQFGDPSQGTLNINFDSLLKKASDFSAGAGDCLTGRCIPFVHTSLTEKARGLNGADSVVDKKSLSYTGGEITGGAVGSALLSAGGATVAAIADGKNGALFGRGVSTVFNSSKVRFGWGWEGSATAGRDVIRLGIGAARGTSWWSHIVFWVP